MQKGSTTLLDGEVALQFLSTFSSHTASPCGLIISLSTACTGYALILSSDVIYIVHSYHLSINCMLDYLHPDNKGLILETFCHNLSDRWLYQFQFIILVLNLLNSHFFQLISYHLERFYPAICDQGISIKSITC